MFLQFLLLLYWMWIIYKRPLLSCSYSATVHCFATDWLIYCCFNYHTSYTHNHCYCCILRWKWINNNLNWWRSSYVPCLVNDSVNGCPHSGPLLHQLVFQIFALPQRVLGTVFVTPFLRNKTKGIWPQQCSVFLPFPLLLKLDTVTAQCINVKITQQEEVQQSNDCFLLSQCTYDGFQRSHDIICSLAGRSLRRVSFIWSFILR